MLRREKVRSACASSFATCERTFYLVAPLFSSAQMSSFSRSGRLLKLSSLPSFFFTTPRYPKKAFNALSSSFFLFFTEKHLFLLLLLLRPIFVTKNTLTKKEREKVKLDKTAAGQGERRKKGQRESSVVILMTPKIPLLSHFFLWTLPPPFLSLWLLAVFSKSLCSVDGRWQRGKRRGGS